MRRRTWILALVTAFTCATGSLQAAHATPSKVKAGTAAAKPAGSKAAAKAPARSAARPKAAPAARKAASRASATKTNTRRASSKVAAGRKAGRVASAPKARAIKVSTVQRDVVPARVSIGRAIGLHVTDDPLDLGSSVALVVDLDTGKTLFSKNSRAVLPIASITKVMTAIVVLESGAPMGETLTISAEDVDTEKMSGSRLSVGTRLSRREMLQLALMSSENRAAHALARHHPGGLSAFVQAMNAKAQAFGMRDTRYVEPTGLSSSNVSTARDLARLIDHALDYSLVRRYSTASDLTVDTGYRQLGYRNTNRLLASPDWDIGLQKTGYISEAGNCLVMQVSVEGRAVAMVLLDAAGSSSRFADANRLRRWIEEEGLKAGKVHTVATKAYTGS